MKEQTVAPAAEALQGVTSNEPFVPLPSLTQVVHSTGSWDGSGSLTMPSVNLNLKLTFANGEVIVASATAPAVHAEAIKNATAPYTLGDSTVPGSPVLLSSANFVEVR
jgi:hypothetical protein